MANDSTMKKPGGPGGPGGPRGTGRPGGGPGGRGGPGGGFGPGMGLMSEPGPLAEFIRFGTEDHMMLHALLWTPPQESKTAVIYVPGFGGGFACPNDLNPLAKTMISAGYAFMAINMRTVAPPGILFASFEDCVPDIDGAVQFVKTRGFTDVVVIGDSLGGPRTVYYWSKKKDSAIKALIFLGAIQSPYLEARLRWTEEECAQYDEFLQKARDCAAQGKGREILTYPAWFPGVPLTLSAQSFVNMFGAPDDCNVNFVKYGPEVTVPVLVIHGKRDATALPENSQAIFESLSAAPRRDFQLVDCDHFFVMAPDALKYGEALVKWLLEVVPPKQ